MKISKLDKNVEVLIASVGAVQSLYISLYSFFDKKRDLKNFLLAVFFLTITLRIVKSVFWVYFENTPNWFLNLGFAAHSAFGPLLFTYVYYYIFDKKWSSISWLHFIPTLFLTLFIYQLTTDNFWYLGGYKTLLFHQLIYSLLSLGLFVYSLFRKNKFSVSRREWTWLGILTFGTFILQLAYFSNYILGLTPYLLGPIVYGVFVYFLSFFLVKNPQVIQNIRKYKHIKLSENISEIYAVKIEGLMKQEQPFLQPDFTIKKLSEAIKLPTYVVSHTINNSFSKNFSEYINGYRIQEAKRLLNLKEYQNLKISVVAYESGFNSLSSFNIAFKKHTSLTPSAYKKSLLNL